jgi:hypothetical protein
MVRVSDSDSVALGAGLVSQFYLDMQGAALWVKRDLAESLLNTTPPDVVTEHKVVFPVCTLVLPTGLLLDDEGEAVELLVVSESSEFQSYATEHYPGLTRRKGHGLMVAALGPLATYYHYIPWLVEDGSIEPFGSDSLEPELESFFDRCHALVKNLILLMGSQPEMVSQELVLPPRAQRGFGGVDHRKVQPIRWVGKDFLSRRETKRPAGSAGGSSGGEMGAGRVSPRSHWRRGHWHTTLHGPGRKERRLTWFEPVLVMPTHTQRKGDDHA